MARLILCALLAAVAAAGQNNDTKPDPAVSEDRHSSARAAPNSPSSAGGQSRLAELTKAVEREELRHFEMHQCYIPATQGNLQWLVARVGAKPSEAAVVWKALAVFWPHGPDARL